METTLKKTKSQIYSQRSKMRKELRDTIMTCCHNAWSIPTNDMKKQILNSMGWTEIEIEYHFLQFMEGGMTQEDIAKMKEVELNSLLACSFYMSKCEQDDYTNEYEDIVWDILDEFKNL
jgi:hypothetical protein